MAIKIHPTAHISSMADIEESRKGTLFYLGARSFIDSFVKVKPAGGLGDIVIGERVTINSGCVLYSGNGIKIGNNVAIAANCVLAPVNHEVKNCNKLIVDQGFQESRGGIVIEDDVWVGAGSVILDGAILRQGCVIGAMSLVRGVVEAYSVNVGNPLKQIGHRQ